jgi:hypothetical protein
MESYQVSMWLLQFESQNLKISKFKAQISITLICVFFFNQFLYVCGITIMKFHGLLFFLHDRLSFSTYVQLWT